MNDFTKEELYHLIAGLGWYLDQDNFCPDEIIILRNKIQSLIDNYYDHKNYTCNYNASCNICDDCHREIIL